jgi:hypothetical protein
MVCISTLHASMQLRTQVARRLPLLQDVCRRQHV